jgi:hypothetical protein
MRRNECDEIPSSHSQDKDQGHLGHDYKNQGNASTVLSWLGRVRMCGETCVKLGAKMTR